MIVFSIANEVGRQNNAHARQMKGFVERGRDSAEARPSKIFDPFCAEISLERGEGRLPLKNSA
jgi:hypothetical protein